MNDGFNPHEVDYDLIAKYLNVEASEEEVRAVENWAKASKDNAHMFASMSMIWRESQQDHFEDQPQVFSPDTTIAWQKVQNRIHPPAKKTIKLNVWLSVAAVLFVVASAAIMLFNNLNQPKIISQIAEEPIQNIQFSEASSVQLKQGSELSYPTQFTGKTREVSLKGEAFFEISPNPEKPFVVKTNLIDIKVLGTSFNVNATNPNSVEVFVETGVVELMNTNGSIKLHPGETGTYDTEHKQFNKEVDQTVVNQFWRNQRLVFKRTKLTEVVTILNEKFQTDITLLSPEIGQREITVKFENQGIDVILDVLVNTLNLELETKDNGRYILKNAEH